MDADKTGLAVSAGDGAAQAVSAKKRYQRPTLTEYGSVAAITGSITATNTSDNHKKMTTGSSIAFKENLARIGEHPAGFGLYLFDYKAEYRDAWGHGRRFGVMAEEVERIVPGAVGLDKDGYKVVDYGRLGIRPVAR